MFPRTTERNLYDFEAFMLRVSISYLVFDTIFGFIKQFNDVYMLAHHFIMISVFVFALYFDIIGYHVSLALLLGELSNPFNIMRKNFKLEGKDGKASTQGYIFAAVFLICRVILTPFLVKDVHYSPDKWDPLFFKIFCGAMWMISLIWAFMILNLASKQMSQVRNSPFFNF
jgi:hypothetical protein